MSTNPASERRMSVGKGIYYLFFYTFYRLDLVGSGREYNKWKALLAISVLQYFLLAIGDLWWAMATGKSRLLGSPKYVLAAIALCTILLNYRVLLHRDQWEAYEEKFRRYSSRGRRIRTALALLFMALTVAMLFYSFHEYGKWIGKGRRPILGHAFSAAPSSNRSHRSAKPIPFPAAILGTSDVGVIPGSVFTSRQ